MTIESAAREIVDNIAYLEDGAAQEPERVVGEVTAIIQRHTNGTSAAQRGLKDALALAHCYSQTDGSHHKAWVIDQMVRALTGPSYDEWIAAYRAGEDGPETYSWDEGIPP